MALFSGEQMRLGRVLHEDDDYLTIEVVKSLDRPLEINDGDRFLTLVFIRVDRANERNPIEVYLPWEPPT